MLQQTEQWYQDRLGRATASRFSDIMTKLKYGESAARRNYRAQLVAERLTGVRQETWQTQAMLWGIETEPLAKLRYTLATGKVIEDADFIKHPTLEAGASADGFIGEDWNVEIKCPETATHIEALKLQAVPKKYVDQVQGQLWITGRKGCVFISFDPRLPENAQLVVVEVARDEARIKELEKEIKIFLKEVEQEVKFVKEYNNDN